MTYGYMTFYTTPDGGQGGSAGHRVDAGTALMTMGRALLRMPAGARGYGEVHYDGHMEARAERGLDGRLVWRWP